MSAKYADFFSSLTIQTSHCIIFQASVVQFLQLLLQEGKVGGKGITGGGEQTRN